MDTRTTRRALVAGALLSPLALSVPTPAAAAPTVREGGSAGWVSLSLRGDRRDEPKRFAHVGFWIGEDGYAGARVTGYPAGDDPEGVMAREVHVTAGPSGARAMGETVPESAEMFMRQLIAAMDEVARPLPPDATIR